MIGISPSDIAKGIQLCLWIYEKCFQSVNSAGGYKYADVIVRRPF